MCGKSCERCISWVDDIYWSHFQVQHFAQFLRTGFDQHIALPKNFSDNLKKKLPENVGLRGPGGIVWKIGLTTRDDTLYFTHGWQQFVKDHSLKENDFMVFKYNGGESLFDVLVFDGESFCEKAASYFVRKCEHTDHGGGCSSKRKDTDNCVEEVNTPCNAGVKCATLKKSVHDNSVRAPAAVPLATPSTEKNFNAGVESASPEKFMQANGDTVPKTVRFQNTSKRVKKLVSADKHVHTKGRGRPSKVSSASQGVVDTDYSVGEVNTPPSAGVECAALEKSVHDNSVRVSAAVLFETPSAERNFNAGVESASPEQFMYANGDTVPAAVLLIEHGGGCSSKRKDTDNRVEEVNTPSDAGVECAEKSVRDNRVRVPAAVPVETPVSERTFKAGVESTSPEKFVHANGDTVPTTVPFRTNKRVRKLVSADKHVQTKRRGRPPKLVVDSDYWVEEVNTPSNAGGECAAPEKSVNDNGVRAPAVVSFETPSNVRTFGAAVESASHEQFIHANGETVPNAKRVRKLVSSKKHVHTKRRGRPPKVSSACEEVVDSDNCVEEVNGETVPNDKRVRKLVSSKKHVHTKRRGRPPKVSSACEEVVDSDNCMEEVNTPSNAGVECAAPEKSVHYNSVRVPAAVPFKTPSSEKIFNASAESASPKQFTHANGDTVPTDVPLQTTDKSFRIRKLVSAEKHFQTKQSGSPLKVSSARQGVDSEAASVGQSAASIELYTSNRRPVTEHEINNAKRLAQVACTNKSLLIVMQPEHVYKRFYMSIPSKWIVEHLPPRSQDIILRMGKTEWHVKYCFHRTHYTGELAGGWRNFALDNNLEEFDVCVFEPAGKIKDTLIMDVNIFRVAVDIAPLSMVKSPGKRGRKRATSAT